MFLDVRGDRFQGTFPHVLKKDTTV